MKTDEDLVERRQLRCSELSAVVSGFRNERGRPKAFKTERNDRNLTSEEQGNGDGTWAGATPSGRPRVRPDSLSFARSRQESLRPTRPSAAGKRPGKGIPTDMTYIPKQVKLAKERLEAKLDRELIRQLELYCRYLDSDRDYVIGKALEIAFQKDKGFADWVVKQPVTLAEEER